MAKLSTQLINLVGELNLTAYGISQLIAAETDCSEQERKAIMRRWHRVLAGDNFRLQDIEKDLDHLGYGLRIVRITKR